MLEKSREHVDHICTMLDEHRGADTIALYIGEASSFADYFVISTAASEGHLHGLFRRVQEYVKGQELPILNSLKQARSSGWILIDCGFLVIHLMTDESRNFYELERLWSHGEEVFHSSGASSPPASSDSSSGATNSSGPVSSS